MAVESFFLKNKHTQENKYQKKNPQDLWLKE